MAQKELIGPERAAVIGPERAAVGPESPVIGPERASPPRLNGRRAIEEEGMAVLSVNAIVGMASQLLGILGMYLLPSGNTGNAFATQDNHVHTVWKWLICLFCVR